MVQINFGKEKKADPEGNNKDNGSSETTEKDEKSAGQKKELPVEKMTREQLIEKVKSIESSLNENHDLLLRSQADCENLKKRFQKERSDLLKFSNESLIKQLLTVLDNLENAIVHAEKESSFEGLLEGVKLTQKGFMDILAKAGLKEVNALGESFDPNFHEAVFEKENDSVAPGIVTDELQKGYILNERLIRPAMVAVSKKGS